MADQDKVEMEQVPLKSDTDAPATTEETTPKTEKSVSKKGWFFSKTKKTGDVEAQVEEPKEECKEEKTKKKCWWNRNQKSEVDQKNDQISIGINLVDRDEKGISNNVNFAFEDIFGEPESIHSFDFVWRLIFQTFTGVRSITYRILTLIIGLPMTILIAVFLGLLSTLNNFVVIPVGKLLTIPGNWIASAWSWLIQAVINPVASAIGLVFSSCTIRKYGFNSQVTEPLV